MYTDYTWTRFFKFYQKKKESRCSQCSERLRLQRFFNLGILKPVELVSKGPDNILHLLPGIAVHTKSAPV